MKLTWIIPDITFKLKQVANWWLSNLLADKTKIKLNLDTCNVLVCCSGRRTPKAFYRVHTFEGVWGTPSVWPVAENGFRASHRA